MEIVINTRYGGFSLSLAGLEYYYRLKGVKEFFYYVSCEEKNYYEKASAEDYPLLVYAFKKDFGSDEPIIISSEDFEKYHLSSIYIERTDKDLIKTVRDLGEAASGLLSDLEIVEIPDDVEWQIEEHDGAEWISEVHRTWW